MITAGDYGEEWVRALMLKLYTLSGENSFFYILTLFTSIKIKCKEDRKKIC